MATKPWPIAPQVSATPVANLPLDAAVKNVGGEHYHGGHPKNTDPVRCYRIIRGQYARREFQSGGDSNGVFVHYAAKSDDHMELPDTLLMTEREANGFGRTFLVEVSGGGIEKPTAAQTAYIENQAKVRLARDKKKAGE